MFLTKNHSRRHFLATLVAVPATGLLVACDDNVANAEVDTSITTAAVDAPSSEGSVSVDKLMAEGPLPDQFVGSADAPVTIVEYASMTCGHCAQFHLVTYPELKTKYIDTGKVRMVLREFPLDPRAEAGFMLARCAGDKYFPMIDVLFRQQSSWAPVQDARTALLNIAKLAGFTQESFEACLTDEKLIADVKGMRAIGEGFNVTSTPTFFINGKKYAGAMSIEQMSAIIDPLL